MKKILLLSLSLSVILFSGFSCQNSNQSLSGDQNSNQLLADENGQLKSRIDDLQRQIDTLKQEASNPAIGNPTSTIINAGTTTGTNAALGQPTPGNANQNSSGCGAGSSPSIKVVYPNGGETFHVGGTMIIRLASYNMPSYDADLRLLENIADPNGLGYSIHHLTVNGTNSYSQSWTIPDSLTINTHDYKLADKKYVIQIEPLAEVPYDGIERVDRSDALFLIKP